MKVESGGGDTGFLEITRQVSLKSQLLISEFLDYGLVQEAKALQQVDAQLATLFSSIPKWVVELSEPGGVTYPIKGSWKTKINGTVLNEKKF
jgi:hypothetical protein